MKDLNFIWIKDMKKVRGKFRLILTLDDVDYVINSSDGNITDIFKQLPSSWNVNTACNIADVFSNYLQRELLGFTLEELNRLHIGRLLKLPESYYEWWEHGYPHRFS